VIKCKPLNEGGREMKKTMWCQWFGWMREIECKIDNYKDILKYGDMHYKAYWYCRNREEG